MEKTFCRLYNGLKIQRNECKRNENCKGVFVNHDPTVQEQIIEI